MRARNFQTSLRIIYNNKHQFILADGEKTKSEQNQQEIIVSKLCPYACNR